MFSLLFYCRKYIPMQINRISSDNFWWLFEEQLFIWRREGMFPLKNLLEQSETVVACYHTSLRFENVTVFSHWHTLLHGWSYIPWRTDKAISNKITMFHTSSKPFFCFRLNYTFCLGYVNLIIASCQNSIHICYYCTSADRLWQNRWTWMPIPQPHAGLWTSCCSLRQPKHWALSKQPQTSTAQERKGCNQWLHFRAPANMLHLSKSLPISLLFSR